MRRSPVSCGSASGRCSNGAGPGSRALRAGGPVSLPRLSDEQFAVLEAEPARGLAAHGWEDQRWILARAGTVIGRRFHLTYTIQGVRKLLVRGGWSCQMSAPRRRRCSAARAAGAHRDRVGPAQVGMLLSAAGLAPHCQRGRGKAQPAGSLRRRSRWISVKTATLARRAQGSKGLLM